MEGKVKPDDSGRRFGTYEDLDNGYTKDGDIAGDYLEAGRDPNLPRQKPEDIAKVLGARSVRRPTRAGTAPEGALP